MDTSERILRLIESLKDFQGNDAFLAIVDDPSDCLYLTNVESSNAVIYIDNKGSDSTVSIYTDNRYYEKFSSAIRKFSSIQVKVAIGELPKISCSAKPLYIDASSMSIARFRTICKDASLVDYHDIGKVLQRLRSVKDDLEVEKLLTATQIADASLLALLQKGILGMTEIEVQRRLDQLLLEHGADSPSFSTIIASGPNASMPHATPTDRTIEATDLVIIDFGASYKGYHSDTTRTVKASNREFTAAEARRWSQGTSQLRAHFWSRAGIAGNRWSN